MSLAAKFTDSWPWPDFLPSEVLSPAGLRGLDKGVLLISTDAMTQLQRFRKILGRPLWVNFGTHKHRGFRSHEENESVNGEEFSMHKMGLAFDLTADGLSSAELFSTAKAFGWRGVGHYPGRNFVHVDLRPAFGRDQTVWIK